MKNAELIKALRCCGTITEPCRECPYGQGEGCRIDNLDFSAAEALEAADKRIAELEAAQRWISVKERLPDVGKCVLLLQSYHAFLGEHGEYEPVTVGYLHQSTDRRRKPYFYWAAVSDYGDMVRAEGICPGSEYVTHWLPLPQPPQKGE